MAIVFLTVSDILKCIGYGSDEEGSIYKYDTKLTFRGNLKAPNLDDTYVAIFAKFQHGGISVLENNPDIKIIYKSVPCQNSWHPGTSANIIVVFEFLKIPE